MLGAGSAGAVTLTSNLGQISQSGGEDLSMVDAAQAFTTGSNAADYEITAIKVKFLTVPTNTATVTAWLTDGRTATDEIVATLTNPGTWSPTSTFGVPSGTVLDASATYAVIFSATDGTLASTTGNAEDTGGVTGWSIGNSKHIRGVQAAALGGTWIFSTSELQIGVEGTEADNTAPTLSSAETSSLDQVILTYDEVLDSTSIPDKAQFAVEVGGTARSVTMVEASGTMGIALHLGSPNLTHTDTVTVSYTVPALNPIQDEAGNDAAALSDQAVTNLITAPPMITSVAITSDPGADKTYAIGDDIVVTVTFDKNITLGPGTGIPYIQLRIGTETQERECPIGTDTKTMVCTFTVEESEDHEDTDGIGIGPNLAVLGKSILGPLGQTADHTFAALPADANHKVDGVKPTLTTTGVSSDDTKIILTFSENIGTVDRTKITLESGGTALAATADSTDGATVEITLTTALTAADTTVTVELDADAVTDVPGNGIDAVAETAVSRVDTTAPTFVSADTVTINTVVLVSLLFDEAIDANSIPAKSAFEVKIAGTAVGVASAIATAVDTRVNVELDNNPRPGDTITVSYAVPGTNPLQDSSANPVAAFTDEAVANNLAATAPDAPGNLAASPGTATTTEMVLTWETPWDNGDAITEFEERHAAGTSAPTTTWDDITGSGAGTTSHTVTGLTAGTEYTFEVRAVNGEGNGAEASVTATLLAPTWEFTLTDSGGDPVTELTEGGDPATATVSITNGVTFGTDQTVTLEWGNFDITVGLIQGAGGATAITITAGQSSGTLEISSPQVAQDRYQRSFTQALKAKHGGTQIGSIQLTFVDDEDPSVASITDAPTTVNEGEDIEIEITLTPPHGDLGVDINFAVTDSSGALSGTLPTERRFAGGQVTNTVTLTTDDNTTQNDGARDVTLTLALNDDFPYTLGTTSSVTVEVLDNDTPPTAPRNLAAEAGVTEVDLTWQAPATDHGQPLTYEYRQQEGTDPFGDWTAIQDSDIDTTGYTVTGLASGADHTFEVRAENVGGKGPEASVTVTTLAPEWELTLTDSNGNAVTQLVEGGASATATVRITNDVRFDTEQTVTLQWFNADLGSGEIAGAGGATTLTIPA